MSEPPDNTEEDEDLHNYEDADDESEDEEVPDPPYVDGDDDGDDDGDEDATSTLSANVGQIGTAYEYVEHEVIFYPGAEKDPDYHLVPARGSWVLTPTSVGVEHINSNRLAVHDTQQSFNVPVQRAMSTSTVFIDGQVTFSLDRFRLDVAVDDFPANREAAFREIVKHLTIVPFAGDRDQSSPLTFMVGVGRLRPGDYEELSKYMRNYAEAEKKLVSGLDGGRPNSFKNGYHVALAGMVAWLKESAQSGKKDNRKVCADLAAKLMNEHKVTEEQLHEIAKNIPIGGMEDVDRLQRKRIEAELSEAFLNLATREAENESAARVRYLLADHGDPAVMQHATATLSRSITIPSRQGFGLSAYYNGPHIPIAFMRIVAIGRRRREVQ